MPSMYVRSEGGGGEEGGGKGQMDDGESTAGYPRILRPVPKKKMAVRGGQHDGRVVRGRRTLSGLHSPYFGAPGAP